MRQFAPQLICHLMWTALLASLNLIDVSFLTISAAENWVIGIANFFRQLIFNKRQTSDTLFLTVKEDFRLKGWEASLMMKTFWELVTYDENWHLFVVSDRFDSKFNPLVYIFQSISHVICPTESEMWCLKLNFKSVKWTISSFHTSSSSLTTTSNQYWWGCVCSESALYE